jgi:hypothetical protein
LTSKGKPLGAGIDGFTVLDDARTPFVKPVTTTIDYIPGVTSIKRGLKVGTNKGDGVIVEVLGKSKNKTPRVKVELENGEIITVQGKGIKGTIVTSQATMPGGLPGMSRQTSATFEELARSGKQIDNKELLSGLENPSQGNYTSAYHAGIGVGLPDEDIARYYYTKYGTSKNARQKGFDEWFQDRQNYNQHQIMMEGDELLNVTDDFINDLPPDADFMRDVKLPEKIENLINFRKYQLKRLNVYDRPRDVNLLTAEPVGDVTLQMNKTTSKALNTIEQELLTRLTDVRHLAESWGSNFRNYALHNYGAKYNFDSLLATIYGYPFWYTRTFAKWASKAVTDPQAIGATYRFISELDTWNEDKPKWLRDNIYLNDVFGNNEVSTNIIGQTVPLKMMVEGDFVSAERVKTANHELYNNVFGTLGPHINIPYIMAMAMAKDNPHESLNFIGYTGPVDRAIVAGTALAEAKGYGGQPGGWSPQQAILDIPLIDGQGTGLLGMGWDGSSRFYGPNYEQRKLGVELQKMVEANEISDVVALDALRIASDNGFALHGQPAMKPGYDALDEALRRVRANDLIPNATSYLVGPRIYHKSQEQLIFDKDQDELRSEINAVFDAMDNPTTDKRDAKMELTRIHAENPGYIFSSRSYSTWYPWGRNQKRSVWRKLSRTRKCLLGQ